MAEITVYYIILIYFLMDKSSPLLAETSFNFTSTLFPSKNYEMLRFATHRSIFERWRALKYQLLTEEDEIHRHKFKILHEKFREHSLFAYNLVANKNYPVFWNFKYNLSVII